MSCHDRDLACLEVAQRRGIGNHIERLWFPRIPAVPNIDAQLKAPPAPPALKNVRNHVSSRPLWGEHLFQRKIGADNVKSSLIHSRYELTDEVVIVVRSFKSQSLTKFETLAASVHVRNDYQSQKAKGESQLLLTGGYAQNPLGFRRATTPPRPRQSCAPPDGRSTSAVLVLVIDGTTTGAQALNRSGNCFPALSINYGRILNLACLLEPSRSRRHL
jgi:hypothetical protein